MAGSLIGALRVALGLDTAQFDTGASQAEKRAEQLGARIGEALRAPVGSAISLKNAIIALGGAATVKSLFDLGKRALDYASSLDEVSQQLGVTSKDLQTYRYIASQVGISQEEMDKGLSKLTVTMGQARAGVQKPADAFKELSNILGKDVLKSAGTAGDAIPLIADAMAKIPDPTKRAALEVALFGKTGQKLDTMLSGGGDAINQLKQAAQDLGLVLSDSQIQNADAAADKLSELKQVLSADIASVVSDNAKAIYTFADALEKLVPQILSFLKTNPQLALSLLGGVIGLSRGGIVGGGIGVAAGIVGGDKLQQFFSDSNTDPKYRQQQLRSALAKYNDLHNRGFNQGQVNAAAQEAIRQDQLYKQAVAAAKVTTPGVTGFRATGAGQTPGDRSAAAKAKADAARAAREAEQQRKKELADQRAYEADLGRTRSEYLRAQEQLTPEIVQQSQLQRQELADSTRAAMERVDTDERYNEQQKKALKLKIGEVASLQSQLIDQRQRQQLAEQAFKSAQQDRDNQADYLKAQEDLTRTAKQRLDLELRILNIQHDSERAAQLDIINDTTNRYSADDKQQAQRQLAHIDQVFPLQKAAVLQQNQGPLGQYLDALPKSADDMNEALQKVTTDGLDGLTDGIAQAITGARSLGSVFKNVANQIIADLARIAVEKSIIGPLGNVLSSLLGTNSINPLSLDSPALNIGGSIPTSMSVTPITAALAGGGPVVGGKNYLVGEQGAEIFTPDHSGSIISNDNIPMSQKGFTQHITYSGAVDVADKSYVQQMAIQTAAATKTALREESRRAAGRG